MEHTMEYTTQPVVQHAIQRAIQRAIQPAMEHTMERAIQPVVQRVIQPAIEAEVVNIVLWNKAVEFMMVCGSIKKVFFRFFSWLPIKRELFWQSELLFGSYYRNFDFDKGPSWYVVQRA
jgi:hypothetical protein